MPGGVMQLDPVVIGDDREDERREAARRALAQALPPGALDGIQVADPRAVQDERVADLPTLPPLEPAPPPPPALQRQADEARQVGDAWRASQRQPQAAPAQPAERPPMQLEPVVIGGPPAPRSPAAALGDPSPADARGLRAPHPDAEVYGTATDDDPVLPGRVRAGGADPNAEIWGDASDSDPVLPGRVRSADPDAEIYGHATDGDPELPGHIRPGGADPNAEIWGEATDDDPELPGVLGPGARPSQSLGDPTQTISEPPPTPRGELIRLLSARQAARPLPSASPAGAGAAGAPDFTGADWHDAIRRPLHAIGSGLRAAAGMAPIPFRSERAQIEARLRGEAQAADQRAQRQGALDLQRERLEMEREDRAARRELEAERNAISRDMQSGRLDVAQERADIARRAAELRSEGVGEQEALRRARREALEFELSTARAMRDPSSPESQSARAALMAELDTLRDEVGFDPPPAVRQMLEAASGEQVQRYRDTLIRSGVLRPRTSRRGGGSGGGGGGTGLGGVPRAQWGTDADPLVQDALERGVPEATARAMASDRGERARLARSMATGAQRDRYREERQVDDETRTLGRDLDQARQIAQATSHARQVIEGASDAELRAAFLGGSIGSILPSRIQQIRSAISEMQASVLVQRSGATVSEEEFNRTRQEMGTVPTQSPEVIRSWARRQDELNRTLQRRIRARYSDDVVREYEARLDREGVGEGSSRPRSGSRSAQRGDTVRVRHPDGRVGTIPRDRLDAARRAGFEEVR